MNIIVNTYEIETHKSKDSVFDISNMLLVFTLLKIFDIFLTMFVIDMNNTNVFKKTMNVLNSTIT